MTTIDQARAALDRATATRRAAAEAWDRSRDYLDMGPLLDALAAENAAADFYHFAREIERSQSFSSIYRLSITSPWTGFRRLG